MKTILILMVTLSFSPAHAVLYEPYEVNQLALNKSLQQQSSQFIKSYLTTHNPKAFINQFLQTDMSPLEREYQLFQLLTYLSQQPPQAAHQYFIDAMKSYPIQALEIAEEGNVPTAIFNLKSKAYGIENIWLAYHSEILFNQLFIQDKTQALKQAKKVIQSGSRPEWLAIKNSINGLSLDDKNKWVNILINEVPANSGLDILISHVGLTTSNPILIDKALQSEQQSVRQFTLRKLPQYFNKAQTKQFLIKSASTPKDTAFSTSLLGQFVDDEEVQEILFNQLQKQTAAAAAAFALSQATDSLIIERLKSRYLKASTQTEKNHVLIALKMNQSSLAKLAISDLQPHLKDNKGKQWIKSFQGERP